MITIIRRLFTRVIARGRLLNLSTTGAPPGCLRPGLQHCRGRGFALVLALLMLFAWCALPIAPAYAEENVFTDDMKGRSGADVRLDEGVVDTPYGGIGRYENLLQQSEAIGTSPWGSYGTFTITANTSETTAPNGTNAAEKIVPGASDVFPYQDFTPTAVTSYTFSVWLKSATGGNVSMSLFSYDVAPWTNTGYQSITVTTSWQRFSNTFTPADTSAHRMTIGGNGSLSTGENIYAWGAQVEEASTPGVYARTTSSAVAASRGVVSTGDILMPSLKLSGGTITDTTGTVTVGSNLASNGNLQITGTGPHYISQGNVGIGTTGPGFPLSVASDSNFDLISWRKSTGKTGYLYGDSGGVGLFTGAIATRTGIYLTDNSNIIFVPAGSEKVRIDSSGNVGIGTTAPGALLEVDGGDLIMTGTATNHLILPQNTDSVTPTLAFGDGDTGFYEREDDEISIAIAGAGDPVWTINSNFLGNHVNSRSALTSGIPSATNPNIFSNRTDTDTGIGNAGADTLSLIAGGVNVLNVVETGGTGNVGIGTTGPNQKLVVSGNLSLEGSSVAANTEISSILARNVQSGVFTSKIGFVTGTSGSPWDQMAMTFSTTNSYNAMAERMRITSDGNVGIGTTSPSDKLYIAGLNGNGITLAGTNPVLASSGNLLLNAAVGLYFQSGGSSKAYWDGSNWVFNAGNVGIGTTGPLSKLHINGGTGSLATGLAFGDGDSGVYESSDDNMHVILTGTVSGSWHTQGVVGGGIASDHGLLSVNTATATVPGLSFVNDNDTGVGKAGADILSLIAGGTNVLNVTAGNVGIGTTSPKGGLDVRYLAYPGVYIGAASTHGVINTDNYMFMNIDADNNETVAAFIIAHDNDGVSGTELFRVQENGSVGIGTTAPEAKLDVAGPLRVSTPGDVNLAHDLYFENTSASAINSYGPLTIQSGHPNSNYDLTLKGSGTGKVYVDDDIQITGDFTLASLSIPAAGTVTFGGDTNLYRNAANALRTGDDLIVDGNVGIGTTGPVALLTLNAGSSGGDYTKGLQISRNGDNSSGGLRIWHSDSGSTSEYFESIYNNNAAAMYFRMKVSGTPVTAMTILGSGNVGIGTTAPGAKLTVSDVSKTLGGQTPVPSWVNMAILSSDTVGAIDKGGTLGFGGSYDNGGTLGIFGAIAGRKDNSTPGGNTGYLSFHTTNGTAYLSEKMRITNDGNVGIGTTDPGAYKLNTAGDLRVTGSIVIGTNSGDGLRFWGNGNTYAMFFGNSDTYDRGSVSDYHTSFTMNPSAGRGWTWGVQDTAPVASLNAITGEFTTSGNVGIGTTGPDQLLHILKNQAAHTGIIIENTEGTAGLAKINLKAAANRYARVDFSDTTDGAGSVTYDFTNDKLKFATASTADRMVIDSTGQVLIAGNVGIGTTGPRAKLDVVGTVRSTTDVGYPTSGVGTEVAFNIAGDFGYLLGFSRSTSAYKQIRINDLLNVGLGSTGNVGIGTTSPSEKLEVAGAIITTGALSAHKTNAGVFKYGSNIAEIRSYGASAGTGEIAFYVGAGGGSGGIEKVRIDSDGNVGIGTTAPGAKLEVNGAAIIQQTGQTGALIRGDSSVASPTYAFTTVDTSTGLFSPATSMIGFSILGAEKVRIDNDGNVGIGSAVPAAKLDVAGGINYTGALKRGGVDQGYANGCYRVSNNQLGTLSGSNFVGWSSNTGVTWSLYRTINTGTVWASRDAEEQEILTAMGMSGVQHFAPSPINVNKLEWTGALGWVTFPNQIRAVGTYTQACYAKSLTGSVLAGGQWATGMTTSWKLCGTNSMGPYTPGTYLHCHPSSIDAGSALIIWPAVVSGYFPLDTSTPKWGYWDIPINDPGYITAGSTLTGLVQSTASGNSYFTGGNVGIGITNPSSKLHVSGAANITGNLTVGGTFSPSTLGAHSLTGTLTFSGVATDITTGTNEHLALMPNGTGNVGIGTTGPLEKLHITSAQPYIRLTPSTNQPGGIQITEGTTYLGGFTYTGSTFKIDATNNRDIALVSNNSNILWVEGTTGNVGIGTTGPGAKLDVYNNSGVTSAYITNNDSTLTAQNSVQTEIVLRGRYDDVATELIYSGGAIKGFKDNSDGYGGGGLSFWTALTGAGGLSEKVRIDKSGNVGIGTTAPLGALHISKTFTSYKGQIDIKDPGATGASANAYMSFFGSDEGEGANGYVGRLGRIGMLTGDLYVSNTLAGNIYFEASNAVKVTINSGGNVGIGTTGPVEKLHIVGGDAYFDGGTTAIRLRNDGNTTYRTDLNMGTTGGLNINAYKDGTGAGYLPIQIDGSKTVLGMQGNVGIYTTAPQETLHTNGTSWFTGKMDIGSAQTSSALNTVLSVIRTTTGNIFEYTDNANDNWVMSNPSDGIVGIGPTTATRMDLETNDIPRITIESGGDIGIGTTNPTQKLQVNGHILIGSGKIGFNDDINNFYIHGAGSYGINIYGYYGIALLGRGNLGLLVDETGSVGVGTSAPEAKLDVEGTLQVGTAGDTGVAHDLVMTNIDASSIKSYGPLTIESGSSNDNYNLVLKGSGTGKVYVDDDIQITGDFTLASLSIPAAGTVTFGGDTNLYRNAANALRTGDDLIVDGNVGIGTTAPGELLEVNSGSTGSSRIRIAGNNNVNKATIGVTAGVGITIGAESTNAVNFVIGGTDISNAKMSISTTGNVGIGTTAPGAKLHIAGDGYSLYGPNSTWASSLRVGGNGNVTTDASVATTNGNLHLDAKTDSLTYINYYHGSGVNFGNGSGSSVVANINSSGGGYFLGNVGIGTTNPSFAIDAGGGNFLNGFRFRTTGSSNPFHIDMGNNAYFKITAGDLTTERFRVEQGGNVGIGTTGPLSKLHIYDTGAGLLRAEREVTVTNSVGNVARIVLRSTGDISDGFGPNMLFMARDNAGADYQLASITAVRSGADNAGDLLLSAGTDGAQTFVTIKRTGNVGIGTTSPGKPLHVYGSDATIKADRLNTGQKSSFELATAGTRDWVIMGPDTGDVAGSDGTEFMIGTNHGEPKFWIETNGNVGIGTTAPSATLDVTKSVVTGTWLAELINSNSNGDGVLIMGASAANDNVLLQVDDWNSLNVLTARSTGNVGIGTTGPTEKLAVNGNIIGSGTLGIASTLVAGANDASIGNQFYVGKISSNLLANSNLSATSFTREAIWLSAVDSTDVTAPDGSATTTKAITGTTGNSYFYRYNYPSGWKANTAYTLSVWMRVSTGTGSVNLALEDRTNNVVSQKSMGGTTTWQRWSTTITTGATLPTTTLIGVVNPTISTTFYFWGWQLEESSSVTSYQENGATLSTSASTSLWAKLAGFGGSVQDPSVIVDSTGNVGIGTTNPGSYKLNVNGNTYVTGTLTASSTLGASNFSGSSSGTNTGDQTLSGLGGAPVGATYITQTADATLSGEQALGALATGILKNTTSTGVLSIAVAADFPTLNQSTTGNAATATNTAVTNDIATNATMYPTWVTATTGNLPQKVSSTKLSFNPSTGILTSTAFAGALTGNVTGNVSGSSGSCTGNAATATNVAYTGLTGTVPTWNQNTTGTAATVTGAAQTAITSVGTLTGLTVTNPITGSVTGSSGSTTGNAATATALQTARNIFGISFNGTADIGSALGTGAYATIANYATLATPVFTTNITTPLIIGGTAVGSNIIYKSTTGAGTAAGIAHQFVGGTNGATVAMTVLNDGNVGIGTTGPKEKLEVNGNIKLSGGARTIGIDSVSSGGGYRLSIVGGDTTDEVEVVGGSVYIYGGSDPRVTGGNVILAHTGSEIRGNVGIGTASPGSYRLYVNGSTHINGALSKVSGSFIIDHPLDPANKVLRHSFVESPDMKNIYDGVAVLGEAGEAMVELPEYFEALNRDFRYQLTPVGVPAALYIKEEVQGNKFVIAGGEPGMKVSWQVTGTRKDAYAQKHPIIVEEDKGPDGIRDKGEYISPDCF